MHRYKVENVDVESAERKTSASRL